MKNSVKVKLDGRDSNYVERLYFEYNASLNIIAFLMSKDEVKESHLQRYLDSSELKYTELEMAKSSISVKYKPLNMPDNFNYSFDFNTEELIYWVD